MNDAYTTRRGAPGDGEALKVLFDAVFDPEDVGALAQTFFDHHHRMQPEDWFIAEESTTGEMAAAFALIPWNLELAGVALTVAEMGIVGTLQAHRGQGLMRVLNAQFDQELTSRGVDLAIIQGIPGFYQQFGYTYSLALENHINVELHRIDVDGEAPAGSSFRLAELTDIPFLLRQDEVYRSHYAIACRRDEADWRYLLTQSRGTEYGSEFWIMIRDGEDHAYFRIPQDGFGKGLIVSEISEDIDHVAFEELLRFCRTTAIERDKPYIRLNLHNESTPGRMAISNGAEAGRPYAWQTKIPNVAGLLKKMTPVLEGRLKASSLAGYTGIFRLDFFKHRLDLVWEQGVLTDVRPGEGDADSAFAIASDVFPALCLGHRSWRDLQHIRPDMYPTSGTSAMLVETLFPPTISWIHEQY